MSRAKILIVEDELVIALSIKKSLEKLGFEVIDLITSAEGAVDKALEQKPDLILMDIILSGTMDGIEAARRIRKESDIPIIYLSANADSATVERARDTLPYGYLNKPINERDLLTNVDSSIYKHRMERRIGESEEKYRNLVESINDIIWSMDENGIVTYVSPQVYEMSGYKPEEIMGNNFIKYVHPDEQQRLIHMFEESKTGAKQTGEYRVITKKGEILWLRVSGRPSFIEGRFVGVRVVFSDVTKQKKAEETAIKNETARRLAEEETKQKNNELNAANEELQAIIEELEATSQELEAQNRELLRIQSDLSNREALLQSIFRVAPTGIGMVKKRVISWTNKMIHTMTGYTEEELKEQSARIFYPTDEDFDYVSREKYNQIDKKGTGSVETRWKRKDGEIINVLLSSTPLDLDDLDAGVVFTALDITNQMRIEQELAATVEKYRLLATNIPHNLWVIDINTLKFIYSNPSIINILGYDDNETLNKNIKDVMTPQSYELAMKEIGEEQAQDGKPGVDPNRIKTLELEQYHKNGSIVITEITVKFLRDNAGKITGILGISRDITEQKRAEQALKESEEKYRLVANNIPHNLWIIDINTLKYVYTSPYTINALGYSDRETFNKNIKEMMTPQSFEYSMKLIAEELANDGKPGVDPDRVKTLELEQVHKNGSIVWTEVSVKFVRDKTGRITGIQGISRDISERKRAEKALAESGEKYRLLAENIPHHMFVVDIKTLKYLYASPSKENFLGYSGSEMLDMNIKQVMQPQTVTYVMEELAKELANDGKPGVDPDRTKTFELEMITKNGSIIWTEITVKFLRDNTGRANRIQGITRDISERKRAQAALEESEKKYRMIIEDSPIPISLMDNKTGDLTYINKATTNIHGYTLDDISTMTEWENLVYPDPVYRKKMHDDWNKAFRKWDHREGFKTYELDIRCKNGSLKRIDFQITPLGEQTVVIMTDLTEKKIQQEMLIQTEKMTSLGGMAAGMAHEINNPLGIILQGVQGALTRLEPTVKKNRETAVKLGTDLDTIIDYLKEREILEYLNGIQDAGLRAAKIITNMLQFSRRSETNIAPVDINLLIDKTIEIAANDYDLKKKYDFKMIQIIREYDPKIPRVPCSETGMEQVVLNLLKNSSQAMATMKAKGFRPTITIKTGMEGQYVYIKLSDNGPGIEKDIQTRIFEPFYSTKESGMGTGLGLSVTKHIITIIHHGQISVESDVGKGATFTIKLPIKRSK
jgi:PAS domain S-box-containing protein